MGNVSQINGEQTELFMVDQNEKEDQTDQRGDEHQKTEKQSFRGTHTVHTTLLSLRYRYCSSAQHNFKSVFQIFLSHIPKN